MSSSAALGSAAKSRVNSAGKYVWRSFSRTKSLDVNRLHDTELKRCLNVIDLTALGVGSTLGAGVYVLTGQVAKNQAGPAVVISFLIAAVASLLAGVCYAEFASRVPRAGSAYIYSYVTVGEFWAFVIGWNMVLENMIGAASVGKAWSEYLDAMVNDTIQKTIEDDLGGFRSPGLATYPDFLAFGLLLSMTLLVSLGVKMSSVISFVFTIINVLVIMCIIGIGCFYIDRKNWTDGEGFFPYGFRGVLSGAATCFYAFVGFDTIATSGEEAIEPSKNIPRAIVATLVICFIAYFGVSSVLTLMIPYYQISDSAGLPKAFAQRQVPGGEYIIAVGGMCGLTAAMMGSIFPLPRTIYSMAQDGLLFRVLGRVSSVTNTPAIATWTCGLLSAVLALLLDLESLVQMMSIGTLMAYTLVSASVLLLRYQKEQVGYTAADLYTDLGMARDCSELSEATIKKHQDRAQEDTGLLRCGDKVNVVKYVPSVETTVFKRTGSVEDGAQGGGGGSQQPGGSAGSTAPQRQISREIIEENTRKRDPGMIQHQMSSESAASSHPPPDSTYQRIDSNYSLSSIGQLLNISDDIGEEPTVKSRRIAITALIVILIVWTSMCVLSIYGVDYLENVAPWAIMALLLMAVVLVCFLIVLARQPRNQTKLAFTVPFVPLIPLLSIMINIYLMMTLSTATWYRFFVWMAFGFLIYFGYGMHHSSERRYDDQELILYDVSDRDSIVSVGHTYR